MYFKKVKEGQEVFGLVFGPGEVTSVWENSYYSFEVMYKTGDVVPYTPEGVPAWNIELDFQTVYYKKDIDVFELDMGVNCDILTPKKIIKLRDKKQLLVKCPSGLWQNIDHCPIHISQRYLEENKFHLFKKQKD